MLNGCSATRHPDVTGGITEQPFEFDSCQSRNAEVKVRIGRQGNDRVMKLAVWGHEQAAEDPLAVTEKASGPSAALGSGIGHSVRQPVAAGAALLILEGERVTAAVCLHEKPTSRRQYDTPAARRRLWLTLMGDEL